MASTTKKTNEEWAHRREIEEDQRIRAEIVSNSANASKDNRLYEAAVGLENLKNDNNVALAHEVRSGGRIGGPGTPGNSTTNVSPGAITPRNQTYRQRTTDGSANDMELAGRMHRGALALSNEKEGSQGYKSAVKDVVDAYNGGTWSSRNDASGLIPSQDGSGFHLLDSKGDMINVKPVTVKDLQNVAGNTLTGQMIHQRNTNAQSLGMPQSQNGELNTAEINARSAIDKGRLNFMAGEINQLRDTLIPGDTKGEELIKSKTKEYMAMSNSMRNNISGQKQSSQMTPRQEVQTMIDESRDDSYIRRVMWDKYGNDNIMSSLETDLSGRKEQGVNPRTGRMPEQQEPVGLRTKDNVVDINTRRSPDPEQTPEVVPRGLPQLNAGRNKAARKRTTNRRDNQQEPVKTIPNRNTNVRSRGKTRQPNALYQETLNSALTGEMSKEDLKTF
ncbi:MAG: hypothetical protein DRQ89_13460, partial [Epsilonproteobacteria bacterium]